MKISHAVLMGGVSAVALASVAHAQGQAAGQGAGAQAVEEIVVTGSRVITNGNQAPTPVTVLPAEELKATTPSNIPDALNRLPQFVGQPGQRNIDNAGTNPTGNYLNLRRFGSNRTLILLDGSRVPPTAASGAVDANTLPQMLIERVEVVTGGASAVYGSDAVTGVVNFILDKDFTGLRANSQFGISGYGDNATWRLGLAAGTPLFAGRGHLEGSFEHYDSHGIQDIYARPGSANDPSQGGDGSRNNPFRIVPNGRLLSANPGSYVIGNAPPGIRDITFGPGGVPMPFIHGQPAGFNGLESGGSGGTYNTSSLQAPLRTEQAFARFSYDLTDDISAYIQGTYNESYTKYRYLPSAFLNVPIRSGNPFLPASIQQILTATNTPFFTVSRRNDRDTPYEPLKTEAIVHTAFVKTGLDGSLFGDFRWNANYSYARTTQRVWNRNNVNNEKLLAASDVVINPANGQAVCQISLTPFASRYPDCQPINLLGPTSITQGAWDFVSEDTRYTLANVLHDVNASIAGSPFSTWAGPVNIAISGEYRWTSITNISNAQPTRPFNCAGLRAPCSTTAATYSGNTTTDMRATQNVKEAAAEALIPLLSNAPFAQALELNIAGRYTDYSTSGGVKTWKVGGSWEINDDLRIRASRSRDIRAPTLVDLFRPLQAGPSGFTDLHTGIANILSIYTQGNPDLVPEVAKTTTVGVVYQPSWIPRFSIAVDYFDIQMNNAIASLGTGTAVQRECENSNGTSPLCAVLPRPLPFSDRSPANYPLRAISQGLNAAKQWTRGWDVEMNYRFDLADVFSSVPGGVALRGLISYQPVLKTQTIASLPPTEAAGIAAGQFGGTPGASKLRINASVRYTVGGLEVVVSERWQSHQWPSDPRINFDLRPVIPAYSYTDLALSYRTRLAGHQVTPFLTIENLFDKQPPIAGYGSSVAGLAFPSYSGYDVIGRFFTVGIRATY